MREQFTTDERGVSEVIGAILVFGLLIALMAILQTQAVPAANEQVEFNHNQEVQSDLVEFQQTASRTVSQGTTQSTKIRMGTTYPSRLLFFNPTQPGGTIRTAGSDEAAIRNLSSPDGDVQNYLDNSSGTITGPKTQRLEYQPRYNEYQNAPTTVLEYGGLYSVHEEGSITVEDYPDVINGNTIDLTYFSGDLSRTTSGSLSLESRPTSAPARRVNVEGEGGNVTLTLPTRLSEDGWNETLEDEPYVNDWKLNDGEIVIELIDAQYQLRMAEVGVGNAVESPGPEYITRGPTSTLELEDARQLPIEVRDKFNNPVSGVRVNVSVSSGNISDDGTPQKATAVTDSRGRPLIVFEPDEPGRVIVNASYGTDDFDSSEFDPEDDKEDTQFSIAVQQLLDQEPPEIASLERSNWGGECGNDLSLGLLITIDVEYACAIEMGFDATDVNGDLDTVEVRMIDADDRTVADSVTFDVGENGNQMARDATGDPVSLIDQSAQDGEDHSYDVKVIATDETGLSTEVIEEDIDPNNL